MKRFLASFMSLVMLGLFVMASAAESYVLRGQPKVGDVRKYKIRIEADMGEPLIVTATNIERITSVANNGNVTYVFSQEDVKMLLNDLEVPVPPSKTKSTIYNPNGEIVELKDTKDKKAYRFANIRVFFTPDTPVAVGEKWKRVFDADPSKGFVEAVADYELAGVEKVGDLDALKVIWNYKEKQKDGASLEGVVWLDKADSSFIKQDIKLKAAPLPDAPHPVDMSLLIERI